MLSLVTMMEEAVHELLSQFSWPLLVLTIVISLGLLTKGADWLVDQAVLFSSRSGLPKVVVGATIVSLGTTTPEAVVSVLAAVQGKPGLALGNAVGSIICDTGLILGVACLISPLPLDRKIVNRQGWIQFACGWLLVVACLPRSAWSQAFDQGGTLSRSSGFFFLFLLFAYLWISTVWARRALPAATSQPVESGDSRTFTIVSKLILAIGLVVTSSWVLIPAATESATRINVPDSIIAATLVAFGTSLPELVTAVTAARQGHGELAIGNVVGADILNVLFVAGASAAVTKGGLPVPGHFFSLYFPCLILILVVFRIGILVSQRNLTRPFGVILLVCYLAVTVLSYIGP